MPSIEEGKTVRFKAIRMYVEDLGAMLSEDPEIDYVTGSATLTPAESYTA